MGWFLAFVGTFLVGVLAGYVAGHIWPIKTVKTVAPGAGVK
jgi:hypothetical protein